MATRLLVGDPSAGPTPGAAFVFTREGAAWTRRQALTGGERSRRRPLRQERRAVCRRHDGADRRSIGGVSTRGALGCSSSPAALGRCRRRCPTAKPGGSRTSVAASRCPATATPRSWAVPATRALSALLGRSRAAARPGRSSCAKLTGAGEVGSAHFGKAVALSADGRHGAGRRPGRQRRAWRAYGRSLAAASRSASRAPSSNRRRPSAKAASAAALQCPATGASRWSAPRARRRDWDW